ncbi:related to TAP42, component of the Tor signaling pathway [Lecanosticta acicola]|uniref:Related to TAP42, component of the Tor signaling pathway n=1 Tax=Lecanosticta acicola TaxID=111012 RepID=A0AAI8Z2R6_9PEZI|nr:related to TAP42, component of the Tor signaling pathway [Lecanosticta acicola]
MAEEQRSLRSVHHDAEAKRQTIINSLDSNSASFQDNLLAAIQLYEQCIHIADQISLFSPNESLEDIGTADLEYLLLNYRVAELVLRINGQEQRKASLQRAQRSYEKYLKRLDSYDLLSKEDANLFEQWQESADTFSTASTTDPASRRDAKIRRFKEEKALKQKLEYLRQNPKALQDDDGAARQLRLAHIAYCTHQAFASLESIAQELHILSMAPTHPPPDQRQQTYDSRERNGRYADGYSERLDAPVSHLSAGMRGPLLDTSGKPLRPFTLTSKRQDFRDGVFRPDHSLPTMSIDEYLEEERRRGGMIDGGGAQSQVQPVVDEDDMDAADRETMKAREWDEYVEANPKGSGNTLNRG